MTAHLGVIIVTMYRTFRDDDGLLLRTVTERRFVNHQRRLCDEVLGLVREHWPEATQEDLDWHDAPEDWDGTGEVWWTTCAEVDGVVRLVDRRQLN